MNKAKNYTSQQTYTILKKNKVIIMDRFIYLIKNNIKIKDSNFDILCEEFKNLIDNIIEFIETKDFKIYCSSTLLIVKKIGHKDITYKNFMKALQYLTDVIMSILITELGVSINFKSITFISKLYHRTIVIISEEYFNIKDTTVIGLAKLTKLRDIRTGFHIERTSKYAALLSKELKFSNNCISNITKAGLLHDIGKVGIKDSILLKESKLSQKEFEEIKKHTIMGAEIIDNIISANNELREDLLMSRDIALYHHEKYDGSGYPYGLKGESIPLSARIFAIVDCYDAIVSKRPYKEALSHDIALKIIVKDCGKHFDPKIVKAFLNVESDFKKINDKYNS